MAKVLERRWRVGFVLKASALGCMMTLVLSTSLDAQSSNTAPPLQEQRVADRLKQQDSGGPIRHAENPTETGRVPLAPPRNRSTKQTSRWSLAGNQNSLALRGLFIVGGITAWCVWYRSAMRRAGANGVPGVIQVYGKVALDPKQQLHFVRIGRRLLVLVQGPQGVQHVTEFEDPEDVERILTHWEPDNGAKLSGGVRAELAAHASRYAAEWSDNSSSHDPRPNERRSTRMSPELHLSPFRNS